MQTRHFISVLLITTLLAACSLMPQPVSQPRASGIGEDKPSGLVGAKAQGVSVRSEDATPQTITFPNMVPPQPVEQATNLPSGEGQKLDFVTGSPGAGQIKMPTNGSFQLITVAGPTFQILDNDATDGSAKIQMPGPAFDLYLRPESSSGSTPSACPTPAPTPATGTQLLDQLDQAVLTKANQLTSAGQSQCVYLPPTNQRQNANCNSTSTGFQCSGPLNKTLSAASCPEMAIYGGGMNINNALPNTKLFVAMQNNLTINQSVKGIFSSRGDLNTSLNNNAQLSGVFVGARSNNLNLGGQAKIQGLYSILNNGSLSMNLNPSAIFEGELCTTGTANLNRNGNSQLIYNPNQVIPWQSDLPSLSNMMCAAGSKPYTQSIAQNCQAPNVAQGSLKIEDALYYISQELSPVNDGRWYKMSGRPLPVPTEWHNPNGNQYVLKLSNAGLSQFSARFQNAAESQRIYPPGIQLVGPTGGTVKLPGVGELQVPMGALAENKTIVMRQFTEPYYQPAGEVFVTPLVKLEPDGLVFSKPAKIHLTVFKPMVEAHNPYVYSYLTMTGLPVYDPNVGYVTLPGLEDLPEVEVRQGTTHDERFVYISHFSFVAASMNSWLNLAASGSNANIGLPNVCITDSSWAQKKVMDFTSMPTAPLDTELTAMCNGSRQDGHFIVNYPASTAQIGSRFLGKVMIPKLLAIEKGYAYYRSVQPSGSPPRAWHLSSGQIASDSDCVGKPCYIPTFVSLAPGQSPDSGSFPYDVGFLNLSERARSVVPPYPELWLPPSDTIRSIDITYHELYHSFQFRYLNRNKYDQIFDSDKLNFESFPYESAGRYMGAKMLYKDWAAFQKLEPSNIVDYKVVWDRILSIPYLDALEANLQNIGRGLYDPADKYGLPALMTILDTTQGANFLSTWAMYYGQNFPQKDSVDALDMALGNKRGKLAELISGYGVAAYSRNKYRMGTEDPTIFRNVVTDNNLSPKVEPLDPSQPLLLFGNDLKHPYTFNQVSVPPLGIKYFLLPVQTKVPAEANLTVQIDDVTGMANATEVAAIVKQARVLMLKNDNGLDVIAGVHGFVDSQVKYAALLKSFRKNYTKLVVMLPNTDWGQERKPITFKVSARVNPYYSSSRYLTPSEDPSKSMIALTCQGCYQDSSTEISFEGLTGVPYITGVRATSIETIGQDADGIPIQEVKVVFPYVGKLNGISYITSDGLLSNAQDDTAFPCWVLANGVNFQITGQAQAESPCKDK